MKCPSCQSPYEESQNYCRICGDQTRTFCPGCRNIILPSDKFCGECGLDLGIKEEQEKNGGRITSERKLITSLFVDISAYATFSERLDPEEVKDLVSTIFGEIAQLVIKYEGHIATFANYRLMALFGMPQAHEDDPVRAVKTASEVHQLVRRLSLKVLEATGQPLWVQIGINTGLTITGHFDFGKVAQQHFAGDAVNVASRLCTLARPGETLVGQATYEQAEGFFDFEPLKPLEIEGKTRPVRAYRLLIVAEFAPQAILHLRAPGCPNRAAEGNGGPGPGAGQDSRWENLFCSRHLRGGRHRQKPAYRGVPGYAGIDKNHLDGRACLSLYPEHLLFPPH